MSHTIKFNLSFLSDGDAFQPDHKNEVERILDDVGRGVVHGRTEGIIRDHNGNSIGQWSVNILKEEDE